MTEEAGLRDIRREMNNPRIARSIISSDNLGESVCSTLQSVAEAEFGICLMDSTIEATVDFTTRLVNTTVNARRRGKDPEKMREQVIDGKVLDILGQRGIHKDVIEEQNAIRLPWSLANIFIDYFYGTEEISEETLKMRIKEQLKTMLEENKMMNSDCFH